MICDAHIHFFSPGFFAGLGADRSAITGLGWEFPDSTEALERAVDRRARQARRRKSRADGQPARRCRLGRNGRGAQPVAIRRLLHARPDAHGCDRLRQRALDEGLRTICLFPAMHRYALHDDRVAQRVRACGVAPRWNGRAGGGVCALRRAIDRHPQETRLAEPVRDALRQPARSPCARVEASGRADHHSALRRRHAARSVDARGLLSQRAPRHLELECVDQVHAGPDPRAGVQKRARCGRA